MEDETKLITLSTSGNPYINEVNRQVHWDICRNNAINNLPIYFQHTLRLRRHTRSMNIFGIYFYTSQLNVQKNVLSVSPVEF